MGRSEAGNIGSIPTGYLNSLAFLVAWSPSVHWNTRFYNAALSFLLNFVSDYLALTVFWLITWTSYFQWFGALGPRLRSLSHMCWPGALAVTIAIVWPKSNFAWSGLAIVFLELSEILRKKWPTLRVFQDWKIWTKRRITLDLHTMFMTKYHLQSSIGHQRTSKHKYFNHIYFEWNVLTKLNFPKGAQK